MASVSDEPEEEQWNQWVVQCHERIYDTSQGNPTLLQTQCVNKCADIKQCMVLRRILYIMQFYQQFQQRFDDIDSLIGCLNNDSYDETQNYYSVVSLLNDHNHLLEFHKHDANDYALILYELNKHYKCDIHNCLMMKRNLYTESIDYDDHPFLKAFDEEHDIAVIQILDKIHCSLYHARDLFKMSKDEIEAIHHTNDNKNEKDLFNRSYYVQLNDVMKEKYATLTSLKGDNALKQSTKYSTVTVSKRHAMVTQEEDEKLYNSDDEEMKVRHKSKSKFECFGFRYYYNDKRRNTADTKHATYISKKYSNLQRELTNNSFYKIDVDEWNQQMYNANLYLDTFYGRRFAFDVQHILSIVFYCNCEALQRAFQNSYVLMSKQDNYQLAARRHREFVNWAQCLDETVDVCGTRCDHNAHLFYQGFVEPTTQATLDWNFNESFLRFYCPMLMTTSIGVMMQYSQNKNGIILSLRAPQHGVGQKYFDCAWLSRFESEESHLFTHNKKYMTKESVMQINDLIDTTNGVNYAYYVNAILILNHIIHNENVLFATSKAMFNALGKLISHRLRPIAYTDHDDDTITNHEDAYIDAVFARFCQVQTGYITVDMNKLMSLCATNSDANAFLRNYLISETQNKDIFVLKCHSFVELFHHTPSIEIRNCGLNAIMFELICHSLTIQEHRIDLQLIEFCNIKEESSELTRDEIVAKYGHKLDEIAWSITITEFEDIKIEKLKFILLNPKCKLSVNIFNAAFYFGNARRQTEIDPSGQFPEEEEKISHGMYQIKVEYSTMNKRSSNKTWMVDKRYSDFLELHTWLKKKRDGIVGLNVSTVRFPPKTLFRKSNTTNVMEERRHQFEQYMRFLLIATYKHDNKMYLKKLSHFLSPEGYANNDSEDDL
eukprot:546950_1